MSQQARTVTATAKQGGILDVKSLVLLAILLAAGFILNMTLGNALAIVGIKPQFIIAAYALAIILTRASVAQSVLYAVLSACVIQLTTSIPGLNFLTEVVAAIAMALLVKANVGGSKACPLASAFLTTLISGVLFAVLGHRHHGRGPAHRRGQGSARPGHRGLQRHRRSGPLHPA